VTIDHLRRGTVSKYAIDEDAIVEFGLCCQGVIDCDLVEIRTGYLNISDIVVVLQVAPERCGLRDSIAPERFDLSVLSSLPELVFEGLSFMHRQEIEMRWLGRDS
jgi:hypothetical protein